MNKADISIGTILYVVIAIIVAVVSAMQKNNKKIENGPAPKPSPKWDEEEGEGTGYEPENYFPPVKTDIQPVETQRTKPQILDTIPEEKPAFGKESYLKMTIQVDEETEKAFKKPSDEHESMQFDLKHAIIYSEIMNRKY